MKPINSQELNSAYRTFLLYFAGLILFSVCCVFSFFYAAEREIDILNAKVKESDQLMRLHKEVYTNFELILYRMQQLSSYTDMNATEASNQSVLLNSIQESNLKIQNLVRDKSEELPSFKLYSKLSENVALAASVKDSVFTTRFQIASLKSQLESCNRTNTAAIRRLRGQ